MPKPRGRQAPRRRGVTATVVLLTTVIAGACGGSGKPHATTQPAAAGLPAERVQPGCSDAVARTGTLTSVRTDMAAVGGSPFGIATTADGRWSFVDVLGGRIAVYADAGFVPRRVRTLTVGGDAVGSSLTADGRYLLVANGNDGASVVSVARAIAGAPHAVLGTLDEPSGSRLRGSPQPPPPAVRCA